MTETIQQLKEDIALLQMKLQKLEEMENHITPCEEAYKRVYGFYPETYEDSWSAFQDGFFEGCKVEEPDESVEDYLKPHTPDKIEENLREAFKKVQQTEEWKETQRKIDSNYEEKVEEPAKPMNEVLDRLENKYKDAEENAASYITDEVVNRMLKKWETDPPSFLRFELSRSLEDRIYRWWETCFVHHPEWSMEECVEDLLDIITLFLPGEQSAEGSQNIDTVVAVEAHNELLRKIKSKLRNKKA